MHSEKDDSGYQLLSDDEIVAQCSQQPSEDKSSDNDVEEETVVNHTETTSMFEELLSYLERQDETSPAELLTTKQLQDRAASKRASKLRQKSGLVTVRTVSYTHLYLIA